MNTHEQADARRENPGFSKQLLEGSSVSSTVRLTDVSMPAILKLLVDVGAVCAEAHDRLVRNLNTNRVECDGSWAFVNRKNKNASEKTRRAARAIHGRGSALMLNRS